MTKEEMLARQRGVMEMSDEELKLKAAEIEGFEQRADGVYGPDGQCWYQFADPRAVGPDFSYADVLPDYCSDISAAWCLLEKMCSLYGAVELVTGQSPIDQTWHTHARWTCGPGVSYWMSDEPARAITQLFVLGMTEEMDTVKELPAGQKD